MKNYDIDLVKTEKIMNKKKIKELNDMDTKKENDELAIMFLESDIFKSDYMPGQEIFAKEESIVREFLNKVNNENADIFEQMNCIHAKIKELYNDNKESNFGTLYFLCKYLGNQLVSYNGFEEMEYKYEWLDYDYIDQLDEMENGNIKKNLCFEMLGKCIEYIPFALDTKSKSRCATLGSLLRLMINNIFCVYRFDSLIPTGKPLGLSNNP